MSGAVFGRISGVLPDALRPMARPAEAGVAVDPGSHRLRLHDFDGVEPALSALREAGCHIEEMELEQPDLEDVFIETMNRA